jgi:hypothetical protein
MFPVRIRGLIPIFVRDHHHLSQKKGCDVIVCGVHNWPERPEWIEVVELRKEIAKIGN